ncbi:hypothetical protein BLOT_002970 [Blomia tropicalis]|nr:hypothetical protein BLOT_002970 [Blomia tropicalis]
MTVNQLHSSGNNRFPPLLANIKDIKRHETHSRSMSCLHCIHCDREGEAVTTTVAALSANLGKSILSMFSHCNEKIGRLVLSFMY